MPECEMVWCGTKKMQKVQKAIENNYWLAIITEVCCIDRVYYIWLGFAYLDAKIDICL